MNLLVTGTGSFPGKELAEGLAEAWNRQNSAAADRADSIKPSAVRCIDKNRFPDRLSELCREADMIFYFLWIRQSDHPEETIDLYFGSSLKFADQLRRCRSLCPVVLISVFAGPEGKLYESHSGGGEQEERSPYLRIRQTVEELFLEYSERTGAAVSVCRFPDPGRMEHYEPEREQFLPALIREISGFLNRKWENPVITAVFQPHSLEKEG